jgi:hypothetical protein
LNGDFQYQTGRYSSGASITDGLNVIAVQISHVLLLTHLLITYWKELIETWMGLPAEAILVAIQTRDVLKLRHVKEVEKPFVRIDYSA